jgi:hypothetical protein
MPIDWRIGKSDQPLRNHAAADPEQLEDFSIPAENHGAPTPELHKTRYERLRLKGFGRSILHEDCDPECAFGVQMDK